jgi:hypothetical protein
MATEADFARMHGVSREAVRKWKDRGRITMIGDRVCVDTSEAMLQSARLGRYSRKRQSASTARRGDARASTAADQPRRWTQEETYQHARDFPHVLRLAVHVSHPSDMVLALLDHLPVASVRPLVERIIAKARADAAESLDDDGEFPAGLATWAEHPWFTEPPLTEGEWQELEDEHRAASATSQPTPSRRDADGC